MQLEPFCAICPADAAAAGRLAKLDWPGSSKADDLRQRLRDLSSQGALRTSDGPALLAYRVRRVGHRDAWGLIGSVAACEYADGMLAHEQTLEKTVRIRTEYLADTGLQTGPVLLAGADEATHDAIQLAKGAVGDVSPLIELQDAERSDTLWVLDGAAATSVQALLAKAEEPLIADGHHRAKATASCCKSMLVALFADKDFSVGACERVVSLVVDRDGLAERIAGGGLVTRASDGVAGPRLAQLWDASQWHSILLGDADNLTSDARLLQDRVLEPFLDISDPARDERLFCLPACKTTADAAGLAGPRDVVFRIAPTGIGPVRDMASHGILMPPKTTWFEPKPLPGIVVRDFRS
ncbi:DUF1015 family protein [Paratractidigestivibacter sp.]|uniref:DUF1015 family protein n=1 Tax=Paratractidigestivibacter sp. TaxID=2847316 RepID=UPI002AC9393C|nr:DUF1015 family protein [Paratractidigestivibacter sp.]